MVELAFQPTQRLDLSPGVNPAPQIVAWIENPSGVYVDTVFITKQTGTYGMGNRPGRSDLNSGPLWPYGRRITTFPVWAHRHGLEFPNRTAEAVGICTFLNLLQTLDRFGGPILRSHSCHFGEVKRL